MAVGLEQRKEQILDLLQQNGNVRVSELSKRFGVSEVTIRIDLKDLENKGLLSCVHGGAISNYKNYYNMSFPQRLKENEEEKKALAEALCSFINEDDTIMMNSGTSTLYALKAFSRFKNLKLVTNSVYLALEASKYTGISTVLLGGNINQNYHFTFGIDAEKQLENYHACKAILSIDGVSEQGGLSTYYEEEVELCRKMIKQADETIVLADYSKIGRNAFVKIAGLDSVDMLISNNREIDEFAKLKEKGIKLILS